MMSIFGSLAALSLLPLLSHAAQFYMVIYGEGNRAFTPGPPASPGGPENSVPILNFTFSAAINNGKSASKGPIIVYREVDSTTPLLLTTMVNNQVLPEVKIIALIANSPAVGNLSSGPTGFFYTLQKARITALDLMASQGPDGLTAAVNDTIAGAVGTGTLKEKIHFSYEGLSAIFFDPKMSKLAQWGVADANGNGKNSAKASSGKGNSNLLNNNLLEALTGLLRGDQAQSATPAVPT